MTIRWDDLETEFGNATAPRAPATDRPFNELGGNADYREPCAKCRGRRRFIGYNGRDLGPCFACDGLGYRTFKTSPAQRQAGRTAARGRRERHAGDNAAGFAAAYPAEAEWIERNAATFDFARAMGDDVRRFGSLTDNKLAAIRKCMARNAERDAQRAQARATAEARATDISTAPLADYFDRQGRRNGAGAKLRLDTFTFSPAGAASRNPGAIYVKEGDQYLGKIQGARFLPVATCDDDTRARIVTAAGDPLNAAKAYGKRFGRCSVCGRTLTDATSIANGIGPICEAGF